MRFTVEFFSKENGEIPAKEFILSQDIKMQAKLSRYVELLEEHGRDLREPFSSKLSGDIFELRVQQGNNIVRVLYFFMIGRKIILTHGFTKKTQKTPPSEIELAEKYMHEYKSREDV